MSTPQTGAAPLLANLKSRREVNPEKPEYVGETLENAHRFLEARETPNRPDMTHQVLKNYSDWWCGQKSTKMLAIAEEGAVDDLNGYVAKMYEIGAPLTLGERRTEQFSFFQDIEIRGSKENKIDYKDLAGSDSALLKLLGRLMFEMYPSQTQLHLIVLDASGYSNKLGVQQTAVRLMWLAEGKENIVVTSQQAFQIVDYMVKVVNESKDEKVQDLTLRAKNLSEGDANVNIWKTMLASDEIYSGNKPVRMAFNDDVCDPPMLRPEKRPLRPVFIHRFTKKEGETQVLEKMWSVDVDGEKGGTSVEDIQRRCDEHVYFLKSTNIRQPIGTPTTEWQAPKYKGEQRPMSRFEDTSTAPSRSGGHVKFRTANGSEDSKPVRKGPGPARTQEDQKTLERSFPGSLEEFEAQIRKALGHDGEVHVDLQQERVIWNGIGGARIEFMHTNRKVYICGKEGQCKTLITGCPFLAPASQGGAYLPRDAGSTRATSIRLGAAPTVRAGSAAPPSQVFAPKPGSVAGTARPMSLAGGGSTTAGRTTRAPQSSDKPEVPYKREVSIAFEPEAAGELALAIGETVQVIEDDGESNSMDRWVCGKKLPTGEMGWFPLSNTRRIDAA